MATNAGKGLLAVFTVFFVSLDFTGCGSKGSTGCVTGCSTVTEVMYGLPSDVQLNAAFYVPMNAQTGAFLNQGTDLPLPAMPVIGMVAVNDQFLYVATGKDPDPAGSIVGFSLNPTTGAPTLIQGSPFVVGLPSNARIRGMATPPNSHFLYVSDSGGIDGFTVDSTTGVLTALLGSPFASGTNLQLVVDPSGRFLYASDNDDPGGVLAFSISTDGALTPLQGSPFSIPGRTGTGSQPMGIVANGNFVFVALSGTNEVAAFSIDAATGALSPAAGSPFATGSTPVFLNFANKFLYVDSSSTVANCSISGYSVNSATGVLTPVPGSPFNFCADTIATDANGRYLYITQDGFVNPKLIDPNSGALTDAGSYQLGFLEPYWITVVQFH